MAERDYTNDYDDWLRDNPYEYQGKPEPPSTVYPPAASVGGYPAPNPGGLPTTTTTTNPPGGRVGGPGGMDPSKIPDWPAGEGMTWKFDPANGWYPSRTDIGGGDGPGGADTGVGEVGDGSEFDSTGFEWPSYTAPAYQSPGAFTPRRDTFNYQPFAHPDFQAPTVAQARENPGYQFAAEEGINRLESSAAGRGVLRSGGTLKDIIGWGNKFADQNYDQVFNRDLTTYGTNRANKFDAYKTNLDTEFQKFGTEYGIDRDVYDRMATDVQSGNNYRFGASQAEFAPKFDAAKLSFADLYNRWRDKLNAATQIATGGPQ